MGAVYRAETPEGQVVALKIVNLAASSDSRAERRFAREVESSSRIQSPYVARTLESGRLADSGLAWVALEFAEGVGLDELVRSRGGLSAPGARALLEPVFGALGAAHREGIVHRDLKPENVRVQADGDAQGLKVSSVKVLDFGIAKDVTAGPLSGTTPGLGTPLWTAPEQAREDYVPVSSSDVWALGLLTFFVLTGASYWRNADERASMADLAIELLKSDIDGASARASELGLAALPSGFDAWFARAVDREPARRFADAAAAWAALEPLLSARSTAIQPQSGSAGVSPAPSGRGVSAAREPLERPSVVVRPLGFITLVIASCVLAGLCIYWLLRGMHI